MRQPGIERVGEQVLVLRSHVEGDWKARRRVHAGAGRVERQLADRDAHPIGSEVAQAQDPLSVGDHDHPNRAVRPVAQDLRDRPRSPAEMNSPCARRQICPNS